MEKKKSIFKRVFAAAALLAAAFWAFLNCRKNPAEQMADFEKKAAEAGQEAEKKEREKIEKTTAGDLLNTSLNADALRTKSTESADKFRGRVGDRIRKILQRKDSN